MKKYLPLLVFLTLFSEAAISQNWLPQSSGTTNDLFSVFFTNSTTGYIVGASGTIRKTTNGGASWTSQTSGTTQALWSVHFPDANNGYAVGDSGKILQTTNGGSFWSIQSSGTTEYLSSVYFTGLNTGYAVGTTGTILIYTGSLWTAQASGTTNNLFSIFFIGSTGYVVGDLGTILKTTDSGNTWVALNSGTTNVLRSVYFTNANTGYAVSESGTIHKTTDGGSSWTTQNSGTADGLLSVHFPATDTGYAVSNAGLIIKTTNGGSTWLSQNSGTTNPLWSVYFTSVNVGYAVGLTGTILYTEPCLGFTVNAGNDTTICSGNSTTLGASPVATGGIAPYSYNWSPSNTLSDNSIEHPIATPGSYTTYNVTVTDVNSCSRTDSINVFPAASPVLNVSGTNINCNGACTGTLSASPQGGISPFSYIWSSNLGTSQNISGVCAGTYTVTLTGGNGCTDADSVLITEPPVLTANAAVSSPISCNGSNDGSVWANPTGGTSPYYYNWSNGGTAQALSGLTPGNYIVTVTDFNGCAKTDSVVLTDPPVLAANAGSNQNYCIGPAIILGGSPTATGGTPPYSYNWGPPGGLSSTIVANPSASPATNTLYMVTVTDANGCIVTNSVNISVFPPANVSISSSSNVTCFGFSDGTADAVGAISYTWSNGTSSYLVTGLAAGTYIVTGTNANGCTDTASVTIVEPTAFAGSITATNVSCFGGTDGTATASGTGGTTPYSFIWDNGFSGATRPNLAAGSYSVTISDANGCGNLQYWATISQPSLLSATILTTTDVSCNGGNNGTATASGAGGTGTYTYLWSNGQTAPTATGLSAGTYVVSVTDVANCTATVSATITEPPALIANAGIDENICAGTSTFIGGTPAAGGGTTPYSYSWNPATGLTSATIDNPIASPANTTNYELTVSDVNGCTALDTVIVAVNALPTVSLSSSDTDNTICVGESVIFTASPSGMNYSFYLNGTPVQSGASNSFTTTSLNNNDSISVVATYNGCTSLISNVLVFFVNPNPTASAYTVNTVTCNGGSDGQAAVTASSGTTPYNYLWDNGSTYDTINGLGPDTFNVSVTDANGCWVEAYTVVTEAPLLALVTSNDTSINEGDSAILNASTVGGTGPISYYWSNGSSSSSITVNPSVNTLYFITATDANSCSKNDSVSVTVVQTLFSIYGTIYNQAHDTTLNYGRVFLLKYDSLVQLLIVDSTDLSGANGDYILYNHPSDQYLILFRPDSSIYPNSLPTYFGDSSLWTAGQIIDLISDTSGIDISTREMPVTSGSGFISGFIQFGIGSGKTGNNNVVPFGDPVPGIDISIEQIPGGIVRHSTTDINGYYSFSGLPLATFKLLVDIPGLPMDSTYTVNLTSGDSVETNLDYVVDTTSGSAGIYIGYPLGSSEPGVRSPEVNIFPNPNKGAFIVRVTKDQYTNLKIVNVLGEVLFAQNIGKDSCLAINLTGRETGMYFLILTSVSGQVNQVKIIVY